jgi:propanol-preferring alcohol dehydrogenase
LGLGETAVVLGVGGIGQILIQILTKAGVRVVAISRSPRSLEIAAGLGAELCLALEASDAGRRVQQLSGGAGAACVFDCVGTAATMQRASECLKRGGQIIVIGEEPEYPAIDSIQIAQRELEIIGARNGSRQDAAETIDLVARRIINPPIAARYPLERLNEAFDLVRSGKAHGRVVVNVNDTDHV